MTLERLEEIEARAEQATPGPWIKLYAIGQLCSVESASGNVAVAMSNEDCAFVISARTDVPALCAALREAWARIPICDCGDSIKADGQCGVCADCKQHEIEAFDAENARLRARVKQLEGIAQAANELQSEYKILIDLGDGPTDYHDLQEETCGDKWNSLMAAVDAWAKESAAKGDGK